MGRLVPCAAVSAGVSNVFLMRSEELMRTISVYNKDGEDLGFSKMAAFHAVGATAASRAINVNPNMVITPLILVRLQKLRFLEGNSKLFETAVSIGLIFATFLVALFYALALFPQRRSIAVGSLKKNFMALKIKMDRK